MAESSITLATDGAGKSVDTFTSGASSTHRQVVVLGDPVTTANVLTINANGSLPIQGLQPTATSGSIVAATTVIGPIAVTQLNVATISVAGTYTGVNFTFEQSTDGGTTWYATAGSRTDTGVIESVSGILSSTVRAWDIPVGGATHLRVRATAWGTGSAAIIVGTQSFAYDPCPGVVAQGNAATGIAPLAPPVLMAGWDATLTRTIKTDTSGNVGVRLTDATNFMPTMDAAARRGYVQLTDGTSAQAVKAASTAAAAADIAAVVSLSPNSPVTLPVPTTTFTSCAASTNATSTKASAGTVHQITVSNTAAATNYVKFYNKASAPTVGTDVPVLTIAVATGATVSVQGGPVGIRFATGIAWAATINAVDSDTTVLLAANTMKVAVTYI